MSRRRPEAAHPRDRGAARRRPLRPAEEASSDRPRASSDDRRGRERGRVVGVRGNGRLDQRRRRERRRRRRQPGVVARRLGDRSLVLGVGCRRPPGRGDDRHQHGLLDGDGAERRVDPGRRFVGGVHRGKSLASTQFVLEQQDRVEGGAGCGLVLDGAAELVVDADRFGHRGRRDRRGGRHLRSGGRGSVRIGGRRSS